MSRLLKLVGLVFILGKPPGIPQPSPPFVFRSEGEPVPVRSVAPRRFRPWRAPKRLGAGAVTWRIGGASGWSQVGPGGSLFHLDLDLMEDLRVQNPRQPRRKQHHGFGQTRCQLGAREGRLFGCGTVGEFV